MKKVILQSENVEVGKGKCNICGRGKSQVITL